MVAVGRGKGTYVCGTDMLSAGKPVLPVDLNIGAFSGDGDGALLLHQELMEDPARFFPGNHEPIMDQLDTLSLEREIHQVPAVAQRAVEFLSAELALRKPSQWAGIQRFLGAADKTARKFVTWVGIIRAIAFLRGWW